MRVLVIDLNNFSRFPTMSVGYLVAILRSHGAQVDVLSPLARGVRGYPRLGRAKPWGYLDDKLRHWSAVTPIAVVREVRKFAAKIVHPGGSDDRRAITDYAREFLEDPPDLVLISTYTMYRETCAELCRLCRESNVPVVIGGNYFASPEIVQSWTGIEGVTAVFGGEPERGLWEVVQAIVAGEDIAGRPGLSVPGRAPVAPAPPLGDLDSVPFPDYSDFPWPAYPNRIVPMMTGRGCGWGVCAFCSDVVTSAGRSFRSRSAENVLEEMSQQSERHGTELFVFSDLKLNSDVGVWRAMIEGIPRRLPSAKWTASVHADQREDSGLDRDDLERARRAGLSRVTTGLESGSQRVLDSMAKGIRLERTSAFLRDAAEAGVSVRLTAIVGYPGEEPEDVHRTAEFLEAHAPLIERVMLNRFTLMLDAPIDRRLRTRPAEHPLAARLELNVDDAIVGHGNRMLAQRPHRRGVYRLMRVVHGINRSPLRAEAQDFEGVM
ncbi:MAG: radical SAM protein [bacterium]|nr:radical SAM protein [bacterium]